MNMTQLYKEAKTKEQKLERHYVMAIRDTFKKKKKHWTEQDQLNKMYCHWKLEFLKMMGVFQSM